MFKHSGMVTQFIMQKQVRTGFLQIKIKNPHGAIMKMTPYNTESNSVALARLAEGHIQL